MRQVTINNVRVVNATRTVNQRQDPTEFTEYLIGDNWRVQEFFGDWYVWCRDQRQGPMTEKQADEILMLQFHFTVETIERTLFPDRFEYDPFMMEDDLCYDEELEAEWMALQERKQAEHDLRIMGEA